MKYTPSIRIFLLFTLFLGLTTCDFWDDLAQAVEDIVDDNLDVDNGIDLDAAEDVARDILDGAREFSDEPGGVLPGGNIGGDDNSIFNEGFIPVEPDAASGETDDLDSLLNELTRVANLIGQLIDSGDSLGDVDIQDAIDSVQHQDEVLELFLTATLEYALKDWKLETNDDFVVYKLVPLIMDVYNVMKSQNRNFTAMQGLEERELVLGIIDAVMNNLFPNMTVGEIFCRAATNELLQSSVTEGSIQKFINRNLVLLIFGCGGELLDQRAPAQSQMLQEAITAQLGDLFRQQNLGLSSGPPLSELMNSNITSILTRLPANFSFQPLYRNNSLLIPLLSDMSINKTQIFKPQITLKNILLSFGLEGSFLDLFKEREGNESTSSPVMTEKSTDESSNSWSKPTMTTATEAPVTTSKLSTSTTVIRPFTTTAATTFKSTETSSDQPDTSTCPTRSAARLFPFLPQPDGELGGEIRESLTNATERLARLIREEVRDSRLSQILYTLLNSDLVRQIFQAFNLPTIPSQTTTISTLSLSSSSEIPTAASTSADLFSNSDVIIQRIPSDTEPEVQAMVQTTIQVLQTANLSDPESIVSTAGQILLDNARQTFEDEVLSDPLKLVRDTVGFVTRNNSLLSRIVPQDTLIAFNEMIGPALHATDFASSLAQLYSTSGVYNTSQRCTAERAAVGAGITQTQPWALAFLDSMGKLGTGFLQGNTWLEGNYDQCQAIQALTDSGDVIQGQYVKMKLKVQILGLPTSSSNELNFQQTGLPNVLWHVCLPKGCSSDDVTKIAETIAQSAGTSVESVEATILEKRDPSSETPFVLAVVILSSLGVLCLIGTAVDVSVANQKPATNAPRPVAHHTGSKAEARSQKNKHTKQPVDDEDLELPSPTGERMIRRVTFQQLRADLHRNDQGQGHEQHKSGTAFPPGVQTQHKKNMMAKFFMAFSAYTNSRDVMKAAHAPGDLSCLHGIRVITILWVILGHVYFFLPQFGNAIALVEISKWWTFQAILNALFAVDTFFTISGCLVSYLFLRTVKKAGGLKITHMVMYYVHRYLRLTPLYGLAILIYHGITPYIEDGPFLADNSDRGKNCEDLWWTNLFYFSNLRQDVKQCMGWSWYLPNDMQFYAAAPLILVPLALGHKYLGLLVAFLQVALHLIMYAVMVEKYNASLIRDSIDFFIHIYIKPYTRCGPYAIGLALGYLLFKTKGKLKIPKILVALGWLLSVGGGLTLVYISHDNLKTFGLLKPTWSDNQMNALDIVAKPLWSLCVSWVIIACVTGYGGVVNSFLSWTAWVPLSRLTFGTYLVHPMVLYYFNNNRRNVLYFTYHFVIERFLATVLLSFAISYVLSLLIESPVRNLIKPSKKHSKPESKLENSRLSTRVQEDQDKKRNKISLTNIDKLSKSKTEGLRNRNIYLPKRATVLAHEQAPSSPEPTFPVSTGSGLYPTILSEAREDIYSNAESKAIKRLTNRKVVYETISKTASFDDEEPVTDFPYLLSQPTSPEIIQERPRLTQEEILDEDRDLDASKPTTGIHRDAMDVKDEIRSEADPVSSQNEDYRVGVNEPEEFLPSFSPTAAQFSTETSVEDVPTGVDSPKVVGVVNEAFAHDHADDLDIVLPSAPPETPESGRSQTSRKAVTFLA